MTSLSRIGFLFGYDIGVISVSALVGESKKVSSKLLLALGMFNHARLHSSLWRARRGWDLFLIQFKVINHHFSSFCWVCFRFRLVCDSIAYIEKEPSCTPFSEYRDFNVDLLIVVPWLKPSPLTALVVVVLSSFGLPYSQLELSSRPERRSQ